MTNKPIVFFDLDGTLLNENKEIPKTAIDAIKKLKEKGVFVALATGRAPYMFYEIRKMLEIDTFVSFNGQYVVHKNEVIFKNPLNSIELDKISECALKSGIPVAFMTHEQTKANMEYHPHMAESLGTLKHYLPPFDPKFHLNNEIYQSLLFVSSENEHLFINNYKEFNFIRWHNYSVDIVPNGGSKAKGIEKVIEMLGSSINDVYAFGDGLNDIEMLETVGTGIAMGNAHENLKKVANHITFHVDEDGIYKGLKHFNLI
ncbi:MAG: haloacid dehalogenase-like family hydrolase [Bacillales bacterium]|jgi:Cof subfamily protein (haloacid dehalogenase superfamily)|nr:haloacid dehalogenase-like family hydrolase [Bacillales bacterium]